MTARPDPWLGDQFLGARFLLAHTALQEGPDPIPARVVTSQPARIELSEPVSGMIFVDDQGNGEFGDQNDVMFLYYSSDFQPTVPGGSICEVVRVFPHEEIGSNGLEVTLQHRLSGKWVDFARYRFPAPAAATK